MSDNGMKQDYKPNIVLCLEDELNFVKTMMLSFNGDGRVTAHFGSNLRLIQSGVGIACSALKK